MCEPSTLFTNEEYLDKLSGVREHVGLGKGFEAIDDLLKVHGPEQEAKLKIYGQKELSRLRDLKEIEIGCCGCALLRLDRVVYRVSTPRSRLRHQSSICLGPWLFAMWRYLGGSMMDLLTDSMMLSRILPRRDQSSEDSSCYRNSIISDITSLRRHRYCLEEVAMRGDVFPSLQPEHFQALQ